jgi:hypothetical protein
LSFGLSIPSMAKVKTDFSFILEKNFDQEPLRLSG